MPTCSQCGKEWPDGYAVCPDDGTRISVVDRSASAALAVAPQLASDELAPGSLAGDYKIECKLGQGGMGTVYGARYPLIGKRAAIKVIKRELLASQDAIDRFVREAQAVNQIGHPNIVDVFGFGALPDGRSFFVMEWLTGESLRARMQRPLPLPEALDMLDEIATALEAAHEAGVVHRDLKPDNVFLAQHKGSRPRVKLLDFGLAKLTSAADSGVDHTRTGVVMGTPLYLSPEQAKGLKVDFATDVYSLGAIAFEMCSGRVPFTAESAVEIMAKHISELPVPLSQISPWIPPAIGALVAAMLEKDPRRRPTIAEVRAQLAAARSALPITTPPQTWTPPAGVPAATMPARRSRRGYVIALVALATAGAGIGAYFAVREEPPAVATTTTRDAGARTIAAATPDAPVIADAAVVAAPADAALADAALAPKPAFGTVTITLGGAPHGRIWIDGHMVAQHVLETTAELAPGDHQIRGESPGMAPAIQRVHVSAGGKTKILLTLHPRSANQVHDPFD